MNESRQSVTYWSILVLAILFAFGLAVAARGEEVARVHTTDGSVSVERSSPTGAIRVTIDTPTGPVTLEFHAIPTDAPPAPGPIPIDPLPPEPPKPEPEPDAPATWDAVADKLLAPIPANDRAKVASSLVVGLDAVITANPPVTSGQAAAAVLVDVATAQPINLGPDATHVSLLAIVRAGDVLIKAGDDGPLAVRYARALRPRLVEVASGSAQ